MGEKQKFITRRFTYEGLLNYKELFRIMDFWLRDKFYDKHEKRSEEYQTPTGKQIDFEFTPWKKVTDYYKINIKIEGLITNLKEVEVEKNGQKVKMHHGRVNIKITGYLVVDYEPRWSIKGRPLLYFIRTLYDQYIYAMMTRKYYKMVIDHVNSLYNHMASYVNIEQYKMD